ncbi:MAG: sulfate ABC transporter permease subunit CysT [Chthoniobacter sp.]|uniref:ABC transporter permease n=1 Tax=Chthoniobacter sp. TaxID=2510640 RepID=UPI0032AE4D29
MAALSPLRAKRVLPGFGISLGYSLLYLSLIVLIPLSALFWKAAGGGWEFFWHTVTAPRVVASYRLSIGASFIAASINAVAGLVVAWVLVRYRFPGKRIIDSLVDLPFALPTAVAGIALTAIYAPSGWIGRWLTADGLKQIVHAPLSWIDGVLAHAGSHASTVDFGQWVDRFIPEDGIQTAFSPLGVTIALTFISLPFVVRTVQPVLEDLNPEFEQAAATLGATRLVTFLRVVLPEVWPALLTGFALAFARAIGEYGSVVFISGNMPMKTEITPLIIISKLEQYDYQGAAAVAVVMLFISFAMLLVINLLQRLSSQRFAAPV